MSTKVVTGKVRFSYANLFQPHAVDPKDTPKYSVTLLIPKSDTVTLGKIKAAIVEAREAFVKKHGENSMPPKPTTTLHDGDALKEDGSHFGPECKGCYVISVSSQNKPVVVDAWKNVITEPTEVYSGCYGRASINFYGYSYKGKKGISAGLLSIQKLSDGDSLGGAMGSADDFDDDYMDDDDDSPFA